MPEISIMGLRTVPLCRTESMDKCDSVPKGMGLWEMVSDVECVAGQGNGMTIAGETGESPTK